MSKSKINNLQEAFLSSVPPAFIDPHSYQSPTIKDKVRQQIIELQNSPSIQQDPTLNTMLTMYFLKMSDAPQDLKDYAVKHSAIVAQEQQRLQQMEQQQI